MTAKEALDGSIEKWDRIVKSTDALDKATENCPLCQKYLNSGAPNCSGCPVAKRTGEEGCVGSPYDEWGDHHDTAHDVRYKHEHRIPGCKECMRIAKAELAFLISLRE